MKRILATVRAYIRDIFNFSHEQEDQLEIIKSIEKGVDFKGVNVWTLIFAIFIASIGLNVNSTAVIIGAMLISPLMGPIMGLGLSVGIYNFELLKKSFRNLVIAVFISVLTSTLYFLISPLSEAQSELLSRTTPTIYDVLIALFGGLAGIVAGTTKEKGNAIPGVAIATALMPPLCTAGFGLATGNFNFFVGAFYLFFINAVMISLSTFLIVRFLKFPLKQQVNQVNTRKVKRYIFIIVTITVLPSIYFAYNIVQQTVFSANARNFVNKEFNFEHTQIIHSSNQFVSNDSNSITVLLTGKRLDDKSIKDLERKMRSYSLAKTKLVLKQGGEPGDFSLAEFDVNRIKNLYERNELETKKKDDRIVALENELSLLNSKQYPVKDIALEANSINPKIYVLGANPVIVFDVEKMQFDTLVMVNIRTKSKLNNKEIQTVNSWLGKRLKTNKVKLTVE